MKHSLTLPFSHLQPSGCCLWIAANALSIGILLGLNIHAGHFTLPIVLSIEALVISLCASLRIAARIGKALNPSPWLILMATTATLILTGLAVFLCLKAASVSTLILMICALSLTGGVYVLLGAVLKMETKQRIPRQIPSR